MRWVAAIGVPIFAATWWGVFNVLNDPSRSEGAPVEVAGWIRLSVESLILGGGAVALGITAGRSLGAGFALLIGHSINPLGEFLPENAVARFAATGEVHSRSNGTTRSDPVAWTTSPTKPSDQFQDSGTELG